MQSPRLLLPLFILFLGILTSKSFAETRAQWTLNQPEPISRNLQTTISVERSRWDQSSSGTLWFGSNNPENILIPESIAIQGKKIDIPIFLRSAEVPPVLYLFDSIDGTISTIAVAAENFPENCQPRLKFAGLVHQNLAFANWELTASLTLNNIQEKVPPSSQITLTDHRGRKVVSQFFATQALINGTETLKIPSAGQYEVHLRLLNDPLSALPDAGASWKNPLPIPFGKTVADFSVVPDLSDGVTTDVIVGSLVALEHLPTTATIVAEDRFHLFILATHSSEIKKNRWPFAIAGPDARRTPENRKRPDQDALTIQRLLGGNFAPVSLKWSEFQTGPESFQWFVINGLFPPYRMEGIKPILVISGKAAWNDELPTESTGTLTAWSRGMRALSEKYHPNIWGLQSWPHPEDEWSTSPGSLDYLSMFNATWEGFLNRPSGPLKGPPIILGGTSGFSKDFLDDILTTVTIPRMGGLAFELYPEDGTQSPEMNDFPQMLAEARKLMRNNRASSKELWLSGTGWAIGPDGVNQKQQANFLTRTHIHAIANGFSKVFWTGLMDISHFPWEGNPLDRMGLLASDKRPKSSAMAYNITSYLMSGVTSGTVVQQGSATIYKFQIPLQNNKWPGWLYVAWTGSPNLIQDIHLDMTGGGGIYALDYLGAEIPVSNIDENTDNPLLGTFRVPVGFEPVFIWDAGKPGSL